MTELQSHNNEFSNIDWLNRRNMNSSNTTATYSQQPPQPQQQQGSFNASCYAHQLPPINSISSTGTSNAQLNHDPIHLNEDARKQQQQQLMSWDMPSATTTTDSTASGTSSYGHYQQNNPSPNMLANKSISISNSKKQRIPSTKDIHVEKNTDGKPPYSYATLIKYAIENSSNNKMTLSEIYQWVLDHYPYYGTAGSGWKNSIRHNLSLNKSFVRVPRPINEPGKGSYWVVDYRSAESEQRTRHLLPTSGRRNNRSGSDPSNNTPYRPEWSGSLSSSSSTSSFGRRDMRDVRSLSMDAAALSKSLNGVGLGGSYSTGNYKSVHGEDAGYYENAYAYGRQFATNQHHQSQQQRSLRHSTSYMPTSEYNVYIAADQAQYQQQVAGRNQPTNTVHPSSAVKQEQSNYVYDPSVTSTGTTNSGQQIYYSYGNGQPSPTPTSIIEKPNHPTKSDHAVYAALSPTPTPSALLPSPFAAPTSTHPQQQPTYHNNQATSSCINHLATSIKKEDQPTPTSTQDRRLSSTATSSSAHGNASNPSCFYASNQTPMALAQSSPPVKSTKQETTTAGGFDWDTVL